MAFQFVRYAAEGNLRKLKKCLDQGIHINAANIKKETALFCSAKNGKLKCLEFLLANGADPNRSSLYGMTAIHAAIQGVHIKCVGILLQYGSDLHCSFAEFPTVLSFARYHGNYDVLRLLHAFMEGKGMGHHQPAQNYNAVIMTTCASSSCIQLSESSEAKLVEGIPIIEADDLKKPDHNNSFNGPFFVYVDGMWRGNLVTVKHAPQFNEDEFYYFRLRKEITLLRQLRYFQFPVAMAICLDPFCIIMERFYYSTLSHYLRDPNMEMEKDTEFHLTRIVRVMLDVAQALSHLHKKQWVHCHVTSQSIFVCDGPRAKLGSLEFCERPGEHIEFIDCFHEELPWLPPETLTDGYALCASDIYSFAATFWECLTRQVPWSWLKDSKIPESRQLPVVLAWPSSLRIFLSLCFEEANHRPTADEVCRKLGQFIRLDISLDRCQLDEIFKDWLVENASREYRLAKRRRSSMSCRSDLLSVALGEKYSSLLASSADTSDYGEFQQARAKCRFRRRSAVVTTLVEEALTTLVHIGLPPTEIHEHDIYKFGFKLARDIAELRGLCSVAKRTPRKKWAKVTMATRDLEEDMFDSLAGYEEVTFRRKHAHAANLKKRHQERTEEKLKDTLDRTRSLIKRHRRKNWACYTMLLCDLYGILRRTDTIPDDATEDFETEAINQSILHLGSQMRKISSVVIHSVAEDNTSGKFSPQWPMTDLSQLSDDLSCTSEHSTTNDDTKRRSKRETCYLESTESN